ncbi:MAG: rhodanese-like domain-containing protein [Deltaproteobacteria bacterium]|nr:rhodanese-like domain-containing protein [Deltaproteobacteria bacterium]
MRALLFASALVAASSATACTKKSEPAPAPVAASASAQPEEPKDELAHLKTMTVDEVDKRIVAKDPSFHVFDANMREVYDKGHVPGAVWVPEEGVTTAILPKDKAATLVFYCANQY